MKNKIHIIGNFGFHTNNLNGQTVRSRTIIQSLQKYIPQFNISYTDTSKISAKASVISNITGVCESVKNYFLSKDIILLPAQGAIKYIIPLTYYLNIILNKKINYIAIGGWLDEFLSKNPNYIKYFKEIEYIYVQTKTLKMKLEALGLSNVIYFPNYRLYEDNPIGNRSVEKVKKLLFFSRVVKEKGVEIAIEAVNRINSSSEESISLHIYGPIKSEYEKEFRAILEKSENIFYEGIIEPSGILTELSKYDITIFPTYYEGEGFPGAILDSISAGVPVLASDWKYNSEVLVNDYTGIIFRNKDVDDLIDKINYLKNNVILLNNMKENCLNEAKKYHESNVVPILIDNIVNSKI